MDFTPIHNIIQHGFRESYIYNLTGSAAALLFALYDDPFSIIELTEENAQALCRDINFFRDALKKDHVHFLPEPDGPGRAGERAKIIASLSSQVSLVTSFRNLGRCIWTHTDIQRAPVHLARGVEMSRTDIDTKLQEIGYQHVALVTEKGEFSRRGWLLDIFPSTSDVPLRLEFFGDEMESIKTFDVDTQRSVSDIEDFLLFPAAEPSSGISLLELMRDAQYFFSDSILERDGLPEGIRFFSRYSIKGPGYEAEVLPIKGLGILPEERKSIDDLPHTIKVLQKEIKIVLVTSSKSQAERLKDILRGGGIIAPVIEQADIFSYEGIVSISTGTLSEGLHLPGLLILTEKELFGSRPSYRPLKKSKVSQLLTHLDDLMPQDFVVHKDHGIGRFLGLIKQDIEGTQEDLMVIEYDGGRLYLPLQGITKITKYHSEEGFSPKIDRLGGKTWQKTKEKVQRKIRELAEKLIALHAKREIHKGFSFSPDTELHREFESFFPYEETPDQIKATEDIKRDMESEKPMDRLICGDVGYGKTEVAMKAAFTAVYDGLQVAVLVPTTILCEQHYRNFLTRFSAFPVRIDYLSRFKSRKQYTETMKALARGDVDIIIGTHSLLGKGLTFYKLGLLIIDEEHRFGVRQKEKIKELKTGVDVLTLTATPIPRTLSMALSDIRDMSLIETPPEERLAVKSIVSRFDKALIQEVIGREHERNGQVFFVHNRIKDIYKIAGFLKELLPSLQISVAHGQLEEKQLEKVMLDFYRRHTDVLVSTAIIGSGLDIPTANTIIINRADMMGLADLYQLKGRVGRSSIRAFAYFLIPGEDVITEEARMRLQAIQEMSYLGAGFRLALKDLEIRGAGNLLGAEQSGHVHAVGFDLYMEMLEKAVAEFRGLKIEDEFEPSIQLKINAFIPEEYIDDITLRLSLYRKIASAKTHEAVGALESEMKDRFGNIPVQVTHLTDIMRLKITARELLITRIQDRNGWTRIEFSADTKLKPNDILSLGKGKDKKIRFLPNGFEINLCTLSWPEAFRIITETLHRLKERVALLVP
jgi:transcription-repair coupling factor (superfamily II helicase)